MGAVVVFAVLLDYLVPGTVWKVFGRYFLPTVMFLVAAIIKREWPWWPPWLRRFIINRGTEASVLSGMCQPFKTAGGCPRHGQE